MTADPPELPAPKVFRPKYNLPKLVNYVSGANPKFWEGFPENHTEPAKSLVDSSVLRKLATGCKGVDPKILNAVCYDLSHGARLGCRGAVRQPGMSSNAPSAFEDGYKVTDAIADWVYKGFAFGPVSMDEVPHDAKFNGIMTRSKPNGSVRIILNLSSPLGSAVNEGIDSDEFPTSMSSTLKWVTALNLAGRRCRMVKVDWADAYKHVSVHPEDLQLQWFTWLNKAFKELCLIFGCKSSAGLFDRLAKLVLLVVIQRSGINPALVCQHLDDCCAVGAADDLNIDRFDSEFFEVARLLGVKLAPRDDPDKSFGPSTKGVVLGVYYDTVDWIWAIPESKFAYLLTDLRNIISSDVVPQGQLWSVVGKLIHVRALVPGGRYHMYHLLQANNVSTDKKFPVTVTSNLKRQCWFWFSLLRTCSGRAQIPDIRPGFPAWTLDIYTDAAGGTWSKYGQGVGAVANGFWIYLPWQRAINAGRKAEDGKGLDRMMSALELVGPLLAISAAHRVCRGRPVRFHVDNAGSVCIYNKGYSPSCETSSALVTAIATVAAGLGCTVEMVKIRRCSNVGSLMADALSKAAFGKFWNLARNDGSISFPVMGLEVPRALLSWVLNPWADFDLGERLLREIAQYSEVLGYS